MPTTNLAEVYKGTKLTTGLLLFELARSENANKMRSIMLGNIILI